MSSLSGKQVGEIKNLYESIYTEETVDETVEVSYDEELFSLFLEDFVDSILETLEEENLLKDDIHLKESVDLDENRFVQFMSNKFGQKFLEGKVLLEDCLIKVTKLEKEFLQTSSKMLRKDMVVQLTQINLVC